MYKNEYSNSDEVRLGKHIYVWLIVAGFIISGLVWFFTRSVQVADNAIVRYEEFEEINRTCYKIDSDLATIRAVPADDKMFSAFSQQAMIAQKKQQLTRWVEEYNAKSRMWNRALWKSKSLPYQLSVNDFPHYEGSLR